MGHRQWLTPSYGQIESYVEKMAKRQDIDDTIAYDVRARKMFRQRRTKLAKQAKLERARGRRAADAGVDVCAAWVAATMVAATVALYLRVA